MTGALHAITPFSKDMYLSALGVIFGKLEDILEYKLAITLVKK
jgi:hypothetical protein